MNTYTKTEVDTLLYTNFTSLPSIVDNFDSKTEIDSTLSDYTTSAQLHTDFYSKVKTNLMFDTYTTATQLYDGFTSKGYVNQMLVQSTTLFEFFCTKGDIDTLLADKVSNTGDIPLPGMLDIGTSAYTKSRIRRNAEIGGYTGYAELQAANSYDMFLNLSATRTDGGLMYFQINGGSYMQLPGSDGKVNVYKDASINSNLNVSKTLNLTSSTNGWFVGRYESTSNEAGVLFEYDTPASSTSWWQGVWGANTNGFNIWYNYQGLSLKSNGSAVLSGSLTQNSDASLKGNVEDVGLTGCRNMLDNISVKTCTRNDVEEGNKR